MAKRSLQFDSLIRTQNTGLRPKGQYTKLIIKQEALFNGAMALHPICKVDDDVYGTLEEAFIDAEGKTVVLLENIALEKTFVNPQTNVTLDLAGFSLTAEDSTINLIESTDKILKVIDSSDGKTGEISSCSHAFKVSGGSLTIDSLKIAGCGNGDAKAPIALTDSAVLTINDINITGNSASFAGAIFASSSTVNIAGGKIHDNECAAGDNHATAIYLEGPSNLAISGGIISNSAIIDTRYKMNIEGTIIGGINTEDVAGTISLNAGEMRHQNELSIQHCINLEGAFEVNVKKAYKFQILGAVCEVDSKTYASLHQAVSDPASSGKVIKLIKDVEIEHTICMYLVSKSIDLNGHTISGDGTCGLFYASNSNLTITDSSQAKTGKITGGRSKIAYDSKGQFPSISTLNAGGGAIFFESVGNGHVLDISNIKIEDCGIDKSVENGYGGAIFVRGGSIAVNVNLTDVTINGNTSDGSGEKSYGGAIFGVSKCNIVFNSGEIKGNKAKSYANSIYLASPTTIFTMNDGELSNDDTENDLPLIFSNDTSEIDYNTIIINGGNVVDQNKANIYQTIDYRYKKI